MLKPHSWRMVPLIVAVACGGAITLDEEGFDLPEPTPDDTEVVPDEEEPVETDVVEEEEPPDPYADAWLVVRQPLSAAIYDGEVPLEAEVFDANDQPLDVELSWGFPRDPGSLFEGAQGVISLDPGVYDLEVQADLPNGDRLRSTVGGVRVQAARAGVYVGEMAIATFTEVQGQTLRSDCVGSLDFVVPADGESLSGEGGCTLSLPVIGTIDLAYTIEGEVTGDAVEGEVAFDAFLFDIPLPWTGQFTGDEVLTGTFSGDLILYTLEAEVSARRVTRYLP
jgi:hypothetical protein